MFSLICFVFCVFVSSVLVKLGDWEMDVERKYKKRPLLSGSWTRGQKHTPTGSIHNGFKMTPLDDYVSRADPSYKWEELPQYYETGYDKVHIINITSQTWLDSKATNHPIWYHYLMIAVPNEVSNPDYALMYNTGSHTGDEPKENDEELMMNMIVGFETGTVTAVLYQVPNEPIIFWDETPTPISRSEDALIAYTWVHYMEDESEPDILARLPMTKAVVRAMDATEDYLKQLSGQQVKKWLVCGASKRGWTTWTTGAYDAAHEQRVVSIIPMVMSFVNMQVNAHHWWQSMGNWSWALEDYYKVGLTDFFDTPPMVALQDVVDPYAYRERFANQILYEVMSSDDEFFMINDPRYYWDDLNFKEKYLLVVENAEHSLISSLEALIPSMISFAQSIFHDVPRPKISWIIDYDTGDTILRTSEPPKTVHTWFSTTTQSERIDFRLVTKDFPCQFLEVKDMCIQPIIFFREDSIKVTDTEYKSHFNPLEDGRWIASFMHAEFERPGLLSYNLLFSTVGSITPYHYPFPPCHGEGCKGHLI